MATSTKDSGSEDASGRKAVGRSEVLSLSQLGRGVDTKRRPLKRSEIIARDLVGFIVDERLPQGARLPREKEMIDQLGVGRTTLREALRILETWGIVSVRSGPGGGPVVRHPAPDDLTEALELILQFQRATLLEVLDARLWLEPIAARLAAENVLPAEIARLKEMNAKMDSPIDDQAFADLNQRFHALLAGSTGNLVVQVFTETLLTVSENGVPDLFHSTKGRETAINGHEEIIVALESGDADRAEQAMRAHIEAGRARQTKENKGAMSRPVRWAP